MDNDEDGECIHLIFPKSACTLCNPPVEPKADFITQLKSTHRIRLLTMPAKLDGECVLCRGNIVEGDIIALIDHQWVHWEPCGREYSS